MKSKTPLAALALGSAIVVCTVAGVVKPGAVRASDHDDGESEVKARNLNLTDLYVFREQDQNAAATAGNLIFVLNCNPRSLARQQYYFNTQATYRFNVSRVSANAATPTGVADMTLSFNFGQPSNNQQSMTITAVRDGVTSQATTTTGGGSILTTSLADAASEINNAVSLAGATLTVFAGLREDPFFFDVEQYFRVRAACAAGACGSVLFRPAGTAVDFTDGYNVLSIVVRVPVSCWASGEFGMNRSTCRSARSTSGWARVWSEDWQSIASFIPRARAQRAPRSNVEHPPCDSPVR